MSDNGVDTDRAHLVLALNVGAVAKEEGHHLRRLLFRRKMHGRGVVLCTMYHTDPVTHSLTVFLALMLAPHLRRYLSVFNLLFAAATIIGVALSAVD